MIESLALKYRPRTFPEIIGQRLNAVVLQRMVELDRVPTGLLFSGPSGTGKTTTARVLAQELNRETSSADIIEIDAASNGGVADIRSLIETLRYGHQGHHRIVIIDEAHSVTREGFNALLKTLEEPPERTIFVLVTTEPEKLPPTILSRLREFFFLRISPGDIYDRLRVIAQAEQLSVTNELLVDLAQRSDGNARVAVNALEMADLAETKTPEAYRDLVGEHDTGPALVAALLANNAQHIFGVLNQQLNVVANPMTITAQLTEVFRDLFVIKSGGAVASTGPSLQARKDLASRLENERIFAAARILWDLKTRVRVTSDARSNLELALILIAEVFARGKASSPPPPTAQADAPVTPAPKRKLTLAELQQRK